jgi:hypothetical protein
MRKTFEAIALIAIAILWWVTWRALSGSEPRVPLPEADS